MIHVKTFVQTLGNARDFLRKFILLQEFDIDIRKNVTTHVWICSVYRYHFTRFWRWFEIFPHYDLFNEKCLSFFKGNKIITQKVLKIFWKQMENLDFKILFYHNIFFNCYIYTSYKLYNLWYSESILIFNTCSNTCFLIPKSLIIYVSNNIIICRIS